MNEVLAQLIILMLVLSGIIGWAYVFGVICGVFPPPRWEKKRLAIEEREDKQWQF